MAASPTRVYPSPLRVRKGLFLAAVHSIHSSPPGFWHTGPVYVWFTCMRCQFLAALPDLPGTCDFPPAVTSQPLFKGRNRKVYYKTTTNRGKKWYDSENSWISDGLPCSKGATNYFVVIIVSGETTLVIDFFTHQRLVRKFPWSCGGVPGELQHRKSGEFWRRSQGNWRPRF